MTTLQLFDTLSNKKKPFETLEEGHAKIYVCGPTVYDEAHIGHARPCIVYDVLVRFLRFQGTKVTYVRNVTDIDDKIIQRAADNHEEPADLAERMFALYAKDMARLHNLEPDFQPKVSEHLEDIKELISELIRREHAYKSEGDVYFHVPSNPNYGKLSHRKLDDMEVGASDRTAQAEVSRKKHPYDFALWKGSKPGEVSWESPFGPGRPGWHIECSAMSMRYLGKSFDLHGGGLDLVFPHHENEIAQSECATGECYAGHWMHNGFVQVNKEKMGKSLGNFFLLREAFERSEPESIRYSLLSAHYRAPYNLEMSLDENGALIEFPQFQIAEQRLQYLYSTLMRFNDISSKKIKPVEASVPEDISCFGERLIKALSDDLNTAIALGHLSSLLKAVNEICDGSVGKKGKVSTAVYEAAKVALASAQEVLGLGLDEPQAFLDRVRNRRAQERGIETEWVQSCLKRRADARAAKDFAAADEVRDELLAKGVEMFDTPQGTTWRLTK